jgi:hypothetical protein
MSSDHVSLVLQAFQFLSCISTIFSSPGIIAYRQYIPHPSTSFQLLGLHYRFFNLLLLKAKCFLSVGFNGLHDSIDGTFLLTPCLLTFLGENKLGNEET